MNKEINMYNFLYSYVIFLIILENVKTFEIIDGRSSVVYVQRGQSAKLECKVSDTYYQCTWSRPGGSATCGIFATSDSSHCKNTLKGRVGTII